MLPLPFQSPDVALVVLPPANFALSTCYCYLLKQRLRSWATLQCNNDSARSLKNRSSSDCGVEYVVKNTFFFPGAT